MVWGSGMVLGVVLAEVMTFELKTGQGCKCKGPGGGASGLRMIATLSNTVGGPSEHPGPCSVHTLRPELELAHGSPLGHLPL